MNDFILHFKLDLIRFSVATFQNNQEKQKKIMEKEEFFRITNFQQIDFVFFLLLFKN